MSDDKIREMANDIRVGLAALGYCGFQVSSLRQNESLRWGIGIEFERGGKTERHGVKGSDALTTDVCVKHFADALSAA